MPTTLSKPAGLTVFPPHDDPAGDCLLKRWLTEQPARGDIAWPPGYQGGIAHRLDNGTSGAILVADTLEELACLRRWFAEHRLTKTYLLLTDAPAPAWKQAFCRLPLAHHLRKKSRMVAQRSPTSPHRGRWYPAITRFRWIGGGLVEAVMQSGITHQIRVHASEMGVALTDDPLYHPGRSPGADPSATPPGFKLHHVGLIGPGQLASDPVPLPDWVTQRGVDQYAAVKKMLF